MSAKASKSLEEVRIHQPRRHQKVEEAQHAKQKPVIQTENSEQKPDGLIQKDTEQMLTEQTRHDKQMSSGQTQKNAKQFSVEETQSSKKMMAEHMKTTTKQLSVGQAQKNTQQIPAERTQKQTPVVEEIQKIDKVKTGTPEYYEARKPQYGSYTSRSDFVYVNAGYMGSTDNVDDRSSQPPISIHEQYWTCSKWPHGQKVLAVTVGVLLGITTSLMITMVLVVSTRPN